MRIPEVLNVVPQTESETLAIATTLVEYVVEDGTINALDMECMLGRLSKIIEAVRENENYKNAVQKEAGNYADKKFTVGKFSFTKSFKTNYDYSPDPYWKELKNKLEARQNTMKAIKEEMCDADGVMIYPAIKKTTDYLTIKPLE